MYHVDSYCLLKYVIHMHALYKYVSQTHVAIHCFYEITVIILLYRKAKSLASMSFQKILVMYFLYLTG